VLHGVRQGFLDEPEDDQLDAGRGVPGRAAAFVPDRQPRRPDPGEQAVKVGQARERLPEFQPALGPQDAEQAAGVGERLPGGAGDPPDRVGGLGGGAGERGQGTVGKGHDDGAVVGHAVVHLAGDAGPFHRRGQGAGLVVFESLGPVAQLGEVGPVGAHVQAPDQDTRDRDDLVDRGQPAVMPAALAGRGASTATASAAATSAVARLIVAATVYRQIASATGNSAPRTGHWASTAAITTVTPNTGPGQTRRSDSTRAVRTATTRLTASGGCAGCAVWAKEKLPNDARPASGAHPMPKTRERGGRVPGFLTGVQKDVGVSSLPFRVFRRRGGAAARRPGRSA
jgi:hypothetical protein